MPQRQSNDSPGSARLLTTLFACAWGLAAAYLFFDSLLVSHNARTCFTAIIPLIVVWATIERKRWGRIALLGMCGAALGFFGAAIGYVAAVGGVWLHGEERSLLNYGRIASMMYSDDPATAYVLLALAATTGFWLRRPSVAAEFEFGKRATLAVAQNSIAFVLVILWSMTLMFAPLSAARRSQPAEKSSRPGVSGARKRSQSVKPATRVRKASSRINRSDAPIRSA